MDTKALGYKAVPFESSRIDLFIQTAPADSSLFLYKFNAYDVHVGMRKNVS